MSGKRIISDFIWNLAGQGIVILVGIIKNPIYTRIFSPEEIGQYSLIDTTFQILNIFLFAWIVSGTWRFYNTYKEDLSHFRNLLSIGYIIALTIDILITGTWYFVTDNDTAKDLILLSGIYIPILLHLSLSFAVFRLEANPTLYNIFRSIHVGMIFTTTILIVIILNMDIQALLISQILVTLILNMIIRLFYNKFSFLNLKFNFNLQIKPFIKFAITSIASHLGLLLLTSSDRYIIDFFYSGTKEVGIYSQAYNLSQVSIASLVMIIVNTFIPYIHIHLSEDSSNFNRIAPYIFTFALLILAPTFWVCNSATELTELLLDFRFWDGATILPMVACSSAIYGLTIFFEDSMMYQHRYIEVIICFSSGIILNIILNIIFIPTSGYQVAGITTLVSYTVMFFLFYFRNRVSFHMITQKQWLILSLVVIVLFINYESSIYFGKALSNMNNMLKLLVLNFPFLVIISLIFAKFYKDLKLNELFYKKEHK